MKNLTQFTHSMTLQTVTAGDYINISAIGYQHDGLTFVPKKAPASISIVNAGPKKTIKFDKDIMRLPYEYLAKYFIINSGSDTKSTLRDNIDVNETIRISPRAIKKFLNTYSEKTDKSIKEFCKNIEYEYATGCINLSNLFNQDINIVDIKYANKVCIESSKPIPVGTSYTIAVGRFLDIVLTVLDYRNSLFDTSAILKIDYKFKNMQYDNSLFALDFSVDEEKDKIFVILDIAAINYAK